MSAAEAMTDAPEAEPPETLAPRDHALWPGISTALRGVFDPEIPVNIYELGLIYAVEIDADPEDTTQANLTILMSLTAPGCPVAGEMPGMVQNAVERVDGVKSAHVELVWEPSWTPALMADTAKLTLNMY
jgi:FeS assembly SUF system protein